MTLEAPGLVEEKVRGFVNKVIKKKRTRRRTRVERPVQVASITLQRLYDTCLQVFKGIGTVPSPLDVKKLARILDCMKPEDVGLREDLEFFKAKNPLQGNTRVTYATIHRCQNFSLCVFFLPATAVIPLHNHPEMTVFSKLLLGTMAIKAYDWVDPFNSYTASSSSKSSRRLAKLKANATFTAPCHTSVLYPTSGGNIHECRAITPCAFLDVLGPPYSRDDGRDCSYYKDTPCTDGEANENTEGRGYGWLEEIEIPKESEMDVIEYMGPKINIRDS
ncbi:2-aminoethanethiol dioxygenase-like [Dorcoceras hygrometricum]|uniref:cysteine dioxygenase n=1 Tax=Dorcoceras hygrometricum TaxID=472368 RepID=A0A2Z7AZK7_9LAMI|nr:2-aminoethanethiol dioxygenase-like [Dorcoceras hygrometricum]